ncbi:MAG: Gfo/Idh/MocA family oxidoreductase [Planctomycetes bacterium]|nr:Gfo/Idh/MocA family oxidoreductase [Planctomycetota bacterium]
MQTNIQRRKFLKGAAITAGIASINPFAIGKPGGSANSKINVAMIGAGGIAAHAYDGCSNENLVALCDVDDKMHMTHAKKNKKLNFEKAEKFKDFRVMFDKMGKDIDMVCINTPDHTHYAATMAAMERGIHVATQKPLTHNIWQCRQIREALKKHNVKTVMCNQGHTYDGIRSMKEWLEAGVLGDVTQVNCGFPGPNWGNRYFKKPASTPPKNMTPPSSLDWDLWLGPVSGVGYNDVYHPLTWRGFWDFGTGQLGDWFCHIGDGPVWCLDLYEPTVVECVEKRDSLPGMIPDSSTVRFTFPKRGNLAPCTLTWTDGISNNGGKGIECPKEYDYGKAPNSGSFFLGSKKNAFLDRRSNNPRLTIKEEMKEFKKADSVPKKYKRVPKGGPHKELCSYIKGEGEECGSKFEYATKLTEITLLGVLAQRFGGRIEWDAKAGRITNRPELNGYISEATRPGFEFKA